MPLGFGHRPWTRRFPLAGAEEVEQQRPIDCGEDVAAGFGLALAVEVP